MVKLNPESKPSANLDFLGVSDPLCLFSSLALHFSNYCFLVHHVNQDDWHHLAHAMASDFTVAWQYSQREQLVFRYGSYSLNQLGVSPPSFQPTWIRKPMYVHMYVHTTILSVPKAFPHSYFQSSLSNISRPFFASDCDRFCLIFIHSQKSRQSLFTNNPA
jgi:hypothetical protein